MTAVLIGLLVGASAPVEADVEPPEFVTVVTGTRVERRLSESPVATEVVDRRELRQSGATDVARVLESHPGVQVDRTFRGAGVRLQGFDPEQVLVLVDGERVAGSLGGTFDLSRLRLEDVERIEIVKGPSSSLYGSDAMGGVVNLVPRRCTAPELEVRALGTTLTQADLGASGAMAGETLCARVSGNLRYAPALSLDRDAMATTLDGLVGGNASGRLEWEPREGRRVLLSVAAGRNDTSGVDESLTGAVFDRTTRIESVDTIVRPELTTAAGAHWRASLRQSYYRHQLLQDQRGSNELDQFQLTSAHVLQLTTQHQRKIGDAHSFVAGLEGQWERLSSARLTGGIGSRGRVALFAQDEWRVTEERPLAIVAGLRGDLDSQFGPRVSPRLALRWDVRKDLTLRAGAGFGFRAASFQELLMQFENPTVGYRVDGNTALRPERSIGGQGGVEWRPRAWLAGTLDLFHNVVSDLIAVDELPQASVGPQRFGYVNVAQATLRGGELGLRIRAARGLRLDASWAVWDAHDDVLARPLPGRPRHRGSLRVGYEHRERGFEAGLRGTAVSSRTFFQDRDGDGVDEARLAAPYVTLDLRLSKTITKALSVVVGADNLLDAGDPVDLPIAPRNVYAGLHLRH